MHSSQKTDIIDLDLDRTFVSSKNHEKDLLIEDLNKQLRFQKFESDKRIKELEDQLKDANNQIQDYEKKLNDNSYIKTIKNLQETLTETEKQLCVEQEKEMDFKREIYQLESGMLKLKQQQQNFSKSFRQKPMNASSAKLNITPITVSIAEEKLIEKAEENSRLLLEKEKELLAMKEKMNEMEVYYQTQLNSCIEQMKPVKGRPNSKFSMIGGEVENLRLELLACQEELKREKLISNEQICDVTNEMKNTIAKYDEIIQKMDQEYNDKISSSLKQHLDHTMTKETSLLDEIKKQDEDLDYLRKTNKELEKKLEFTRKQKESMEIEHQKKFEALEKKDLKSEVKKVEEKYQKILQDAKEKLEFQLASKEDIIKDLENVKSMNMKKILHFEGENKKLGEMNLRLQEKMAQIEKMQAESEEKFTDIIKNYEMKFIELESNYEFEKHTNSYFRNINRGGNFTLAKMNPSEMTLIDKSELGDGQTPCNPKNLSNELKGLDGNAFFSPSRSSFLTPQGVFNFVIEEDQLKESGILQKRITSALKFKTKSNLSESFGEIKESEQKSATNLNVSKTEVVEEEKEENENNQEKEQRNNELMMMRESFKKMDESSSLRKNLSEKDEEIESLNREIKNLKENLENVKNKWLVEMENQRNKQLENVLEAQRARNTTINVLLKNDDRNFSNIAADPQMKKISKEKRELEAENHRLKREFQDEMEFLKEEMKKLEERNEENNSKLVKSLNERDYFEQQWKMVMDDMKLGKMDVEKEKRDNKEKKISKWLFCTCK